MKRRKFRLVAAFTAVLIFPALLLSQDTRGQVKPSTNQKATLVDEFGMTTECDIGARIDNLFIQVNGNPSSHVVIIMYRGTTDLPARQSQDFVKTQFNWIQKPIAFRKYDQSLLTVIDGGFRNADSLDNEAWLVPKGAANPKPSRTVQPPELPKYKAFKVDELSFNDVIGMAAFGQEQYQGEANDPQAANQVDNEPISGEESEETSDVEDEYYFSEFFASQLRSDSSYTGVVIYYANPDDYDLGKARTLMDEYLQKYAKKSEINLNRMHLVYGGYKREPSLEFWLVPKNTNEPLPTPEIKSAQNPEKL